MHAALLAALAVDRVDRLPAFDRSATTFLRWPGMIQKNTLALIAVAIIAPTSRKAARPANQWQASQDAKHDEHQHQHADDGVAVLALAEDAGRCAS